MEGGSAASVIVGGCATDHTCNGHDDDVSNKYVIQTRQWTERVPIGLGLCPWAGRSLRSGRLRVVACDAVVSENVGVFVLEEAKQLLCESAKAQEEEWTTTLVVCPHVGEWHEDFACFDRYVQALKDKLANIEDGPDIGETLDQITLVAFHPNFTRWHALPRNVDVGSLVRCHRGMCGFEKSQGVHLAKIIETGGIQLWKAQGQGSIRGGWQGTIRADRLADVRCRRHHVAKGRVTSRQCHAPSSVSDDPFDTECGSGIALCQRCQSGEEEECTAYGETWVGWNSRKAGGCMTVIHVKY